MKVTDNYKKHKNNNPLQRFLLNRFYESLIEILHFPPRGLASSKRRVQDDELKSILDAGCGEGFTLNKLYQNKIGQKLEGIEFSKDAVEIGRKLHPHLSLREGDIYKLPFKDNSFDLVLSTEVLEHLKEPEKALKEIIRVSRKYILLSVPNEPFFMLSNFLRGKNITRWGNDIEHINYWTSQGFEKFVKKENVRIIKVKTPFPWTMVLLEKI